MLLLSAFKVWHAHTVTVVNIENCAWYQLSWFSDKLIFSLIIERIQEGIHISYFRFLAFSISLCLTKNCWHDQIYCLNFLPSVIGPLWQTYLMSYLWRIFILWSVFRICCLWGFELQNANDQYLTEWKEGRRQGEQIIENIYIGMNFKCADSFRTPWRLSKEYWRKNH